MLQSTKKNIFINLLKIQLKKVIKEPNQLDLIDSLLSAMLESNNIKELLNIVITKLEEIYPNNFKSEQVMIMVNSIRNNNSLSNDELLHVMFNLLKILNPKINIDILEDYAPMLLTLLGDECNSNQSGTDLDSSKTVTVNNQSINKHSDESIDKYLF